MGTNFPKIMKEFCCIDANDIIENDNFHDSLFKSTKRGVKPLLEVIDNNLDYKNGIAVDKVVGKAAALLYVIIGIKTLHADIISQYALDVLNKNNIETTYNNLVPSILNRKKDGYCPMESTCKDIDDPDIAIISIKNKLKELEKGSV